MSTYNRIKIQMRPPMRFVQVQILSGLGAGAMFIKDYRAAFSWYRIPQHKTSPRFTYGFPIALLRLRDAAAGSSSFATQRTGYSLPPQGDACLIDSTLCHKLTAIVDTFTPGVLEGRRRLIHLYDFCGQVEVPEPRNVVSFAFQFVHCARAEDGASRSAFERTQFSN
jgi:hypothetical protein